MNSNTNSDFRTVRGYQLANKKKGQITPAMEDYLEMVFRLCAEHNYARIGQLSELLHVKPSSASKMISKLADLGYLKYDRYEIIQLTETGHEFGEYLLKRHETVEAFLKLVGNSDPLEETELIEHALSSSTVDAIGALNAFFAEEEGIRQKFIAFMESAISEKRETI
jgi:DtxR family Mn-dependent transcriptional regulator